MPKTRKTKTLIDEVYTKTHRLKRVADLHEEKLLKRGAKVSRKKTKAGNKLDYTF